MSPDPFDDLDLDRALASGLSALAPDIGPAEASLVTMRPRFERARTRRRVVRASAVAVVLLFIGSAAALEAPSARRSHVRVASPPTTASPTTTTQPKTTTTPTPTPRKAPRPPAAPPAVPAPNPTSGSASHPSTGATVPVYVGPTPVPTLPPPTRPAPAPATTPTTAVPHLGGVRYYSLGGSIVVRLVHGQMSLLQVSPARGYREQVLIRYPLHIYVLFWRDHRIASRIELIVVDGKVMRIAHSSTNSANLDASHHGSHASSNSMNSHVESNSSSDSGGSHSSTNTGGNVANSAVTNSNTTSNSTTTTATATASN